MKNLVTGLGVFALLFLMSSCDSGTEEYDIPTTYSFDNVDYSGQTQRLAMLTEMVDYVSSGKTGTVLDATRLKAMYSNDVANAGFTGSYDASKQLKSKTFESVQAIVETLIDGAVVASQSTTAASNGQAGVISSADGTKSYLIGANGLQYDEAIEKTLMGACFYYQSTSVYFGTDKMNVDNEAVVDGEGTAMEHHWDEAFGYWGVPTDFPTNTSDLYFWGNYSNTVNAALGTNKKLMDAFLKGRAAISNQDIAVRDEAIIEARAAWEEIVAGAAIHYLNKSKENINDPALLVHTLSEGVGFVYSLQFNEGKTLTNAQINVILTTMAGSADFETMNLFNTTEAQIIEARDALAAYFGWDATLVESL